MAPVLGYWKLRGLGQHIRLLLEYTETPYTEKLYEMEMEKGDDYNIQWMKEKFTLGMDFPNLPYFIDGDRKITQSNAIARHIARKHNLTGQTEDQKIMCDVLENQAMDYRMGFGTLCYSNLADFEENKPKYVNETMKTMFESLSKVLGNKKWFGGDEITLADFTLYEVIDVHRELDCCSLKNFKSLSDFLTRFESLPAIKKYMNSSNFIKNPINGAMASFGGK